MLAEIGFIGPCETIVQLKLTRSIKIIGLSEEMIEADEITKGEWS